VIDSHPAQHERDPIRQRVRIDADPDADAHGSAAGSSSSDRILAAFGGGWYR
jgi:hypothetical protein